MQAVSNGVTDNAGNTLDAIAINGNIDMPGGKRGSYDYYIRDYQQNVRMILTEETHSSYGTASMEDSRAGSEEPVFGQTGGANEVNTTRVNTPSGWGSNSSGRVSQLSKSTGHTVGPNSLLKVMAGDEISSSAQYYYQSPVTNNNNSLVSDIVTSLIQAISGNAAASHATEAGTAGISSNLNTSGGPLATIADPHQYTGDNIPRAYLNILFFDERFNFVGENSTLARVNQPGDGAAPLVLANIKAPKNGYAYVFVSNESDQSVYFDNFKVAHSRGRIIEENHYYAYGLKIAGISSKKLPDANEGHIDNKNLYNDKELFDDGDLNWYDYGFRNYDPQIGRFVQIDPLTGMYPDLSPYNYGGNDPIGNIDEDGLSLADPLVGFAGHEAKNLGEVVVTGVRHAAPVAAKSTGSMAKVVLKTFIQLSISMANDYFENVKNHMSAIGNKVKESV
jgi:RHS repeat-associated protein